MAIRFSYQSNTNTPVPAGHPAFRFCLLFIFCLLARHIVHAQQTNFEDGFEDGTFVENPAWGGDITDFTIVNGFPNKMLRLKAAGTGFSYLSTPSRNMVGSWEFYVQFDGFEPSASNRALIYLASDIPDLGGEVNGYAVTVGETGEDVFRLVRIDGGQEGALLLSDSTAVRPADAGYRIKVTRSEQGYWNMEVGRSYSGALFTTGDTAVDTTHTISSHFGVKVHYTSTRAERFYFDFKIDLPPFLAETVIPRSHLADVVFNRPFDPATVQPSDFSIDRGIGSPSRISTPASNIVRLHYRAPFPSEVYRLHIGAISDLNGMETGRLTRLAFTVFGRHQPGDIVINEIMYDPLVGQAEYVELLNTSDKILNLNGWNLSDRSVSGMLTADTVAIKARGYLVISDDTLSLFNTYGHLPFLLMSGFPSLNTEDRISLTDASGFIADSVTYSPSWHNPNFLDSRGIALERINPGISTDNAANWSSSVHPKGGTPGTRNSLFRQLLLQPGRSALHFSPNPFSPDDDGRDDHLLVHYRLDEPDYLITVVVYDRYGRRIRKLADGRPAGFEGTLIWDGRQDDGSPNRIGIYIMVLEAYNSAAGRNLAFKETVVLARRLK